MTEMSDQEDIKEEAQSGHHGVVAEARGTDPITVSG